MTELFGDENSYRSTSKKILKKLRLDIQHIRMLIHQGNTDIFSMPPRAGEKEIRILRILQPYRDQITPDIFLELADTIIPHVQASCYEKQKHLEHILIVKSRSQPHQDIREKIQEAYRNNRIEIDPDDIEIIIDAHDIGLELGGITFVTGDYAHIVSAEKHICQLTSITAVCPLDSLNK